MTWYAGDLVLSVGQLELDAVYTGDPVHYGMTLEAGIVVFLACARFDKAHAAGLARGDDENTLSAALRGRHRGDGAVYTLTPRLALTWRADGMPRIALDGVVYDGVVAPAK